MKRPEDQHTHGNGEVGPMSTAELLEHAVIEAMGLLDDEDRAAFDRALDASPATLRELIRAEQARIAETIDFLPDAEPDPALRERTLARIREEIAERMGQPPARSVAHVARSAATPRPPRLQRARRVSPSWRGAAVGLMVALVVISVMHVQLRQRFDDVREQGRMASFMDGIGLERIESALFSASTKRFVFTPVGSTDRAKAAIEYDPDTDNARLYVLNLSTQKTYSLVTVDADNNPTGKIMDFKPTGIFGGFDVNMSQAGPIRVAIVTADETREVLFVADVRLA